MGRCDGAVSSSSDTRSKTSRDLFFFCLLLRPLSVSDSIPGGEGTTASTLVFTVGVLSLLLLLSRFHSLFLVITS